MRFLCGLSIWGLAGASPPLSVEDVKMRLISKEALHRGHDELPVRSRHLNVDNLPDSFDSRTAWPNCDSISDIWDQGACGDCWAVATVTVASDRMCIGTGGAQDGGKQPRLSVEQMVGCCKGCGFGCGNGFPNYAWMWLAGKHVPGSTAGVYGLVTGGEQGDNSWCSAYTVPACNHYDTPGEPLPSCEGGIPAQSPKCPTACDANSTYKVPFAQDNHRFQSSYSVPSEEKQIRAEILAHGPVTAGFNVYSDWVHYRNGVYKAGGGEELGAHAVRIIGWGAEAGDDYWLVSNSFGSKWGDGGYFKIKRGTDECAIESSVLAGLYKDASTSVIV